MITHDIKRIIQVFLAIVFTAIGLACSTPTAPKPVGKDPSIRVLNQAPDSFVLSFGSPDSTGRFAHVTWTIPPADTVCAVWTQPINDSLIVTLIRSAGPEPGWNNDTLVAQRELPGVVSPFHTITITPFNPANLFGMATMTQDTVPCGPMTPPRAG